MYGCDNYIGDYTMYTNGTVEAPFRMIKTEYGGFAMFDCQQPKEELVLTMVGTQYNTVQHSATQCNTVQRGPYCTPPYPTIPPPYPTTPHRSSTFSS